MAKSVSFYLEKGFEPKMAEYFASGRRKIVEVKPNVDFSLTLSFDNGEKRIYDVLPLLKEGTVFENFSNKKNFYRVYLDDDNCVAWDICPDIDSTIVWNNKVSLCPDECYVNSRLIDEPDSISSEE